MKKLLISLAIVVATIQVAGQSMEFFVNFSEKQAAPNFSFFSERRINDKFGYAFFSLVSESWAEAYVGPVYSPSSRISLYTFIGVETGGSHLRGSVGLWADLGSSIHFLGFYEKGQGSDNYWYHGQVMRQSERLNYGLMTRRFSGFGPRIEIPASKYFSFWLASLYDFEFSEIKGVCSVVLNF